MTEIEFNRFKEFMRKLKYEIMDLNDYEIIFKDLGGQEVIKHKTENKWILYTMCHNLNLFDGSPKLEFYTETRSLMCYTKCGQAMDIIELVKKRFNLQGKECSCYKATKYICNRLKIKFDFKDEVERDKTYLYNWKSSLQKYLKTSSNISEEKIYDKSILNYFEDKPHQSWLDEGITKSTMEKYGIKWYPYKQQIVIPVYSDKADLVGIRIRNVNPHEVETSGKYKPLELIDSTIYSFPTSKYFYGANYNAKEISRTKKVILVEGEKSVLKSDVFFGEKSITLALFGHELSKDKLKYLIELGCEEITLCLDFDYHKINDEEYKRYVENVNKIYFKCKPYMKNIYVMVNPNEINEYYKSNPFDLTKEEFEWFWGQRKLIE